VVADQKADGYARKEGEFTFADESVVSGRSIETAARAEWANRNTRPVDQSFLRGSATQESRSADVKPMLAEKFKPFDAKVGFLNSSTMAFVCLLRGWIFCSAVLPKRA